MQNYFLKLIEVLLNQIKRLSPVIFGFLIFLLVLEFIFFRFRSRMYHREIKRLSEERRKITQYLANFDSKEEALRKKGRQKDASD